MSENPRYRHAKTQPWHEGQYVIVDGVRCLYEHREGRIMVMLPGGRAAPLDDLRAGGKKIVLPSLPRVLTAGQVAFLRAMGAEIE